MEEWRCIEERPSYQVSNLGRVRSAGGTILVATKTGDGYLKVSLKRGPEVKRFVHRLVAIAFVANDDGKLAVHHLNGARTDNRAGNLRWVTASENNKNRALATGNRYHWRRRVLQKDDTGHVVREWDSVSQAAATLKLSGPGISQCCNGRAGYRSCGGFRWEFATEVDTPEAVLENELWAPCAKHPDVEISSLGRVRTQKRGVVSGSKINGYLVFRGTGVHRLVASAFPDLCPPSGGSAIINHKDGNKLNNEAANLEWCTQARNVAHALNTGLVRTRAVVRHLAGGSTIVYSSAAEAGRSLGLHPSCITRACQGAQQIAGGHRWAYEPSRAAQAEYRIADDDPLWAELGL